MVKKIHHRLYSVHRVVCDCSVRLGNWQENNSCHCGRERTNVRVSVCGVCVGGREGGEDTRHAHGENDSESINHIMAIEVQTCSILGDNSIVVHHFEQNNGPHVK